MFSLIKLFSLSLYNTNLYYPPWYITFSCVCHSRSLRPMTQCSHAVAFVPSSITYCKLGYLVWFKNNHRIWMWRNFIIPPRRHDTAESSFHYFIRRQNFIHWFYTGLIWGKDVKKRAVAYTRELVCGSLVFLPCMWDKNNFFLLLLQLSVTATKGPLSRTKSQLNSWHRWYPHSVLRVI